MVAEVNYSCYLCPTKNHSDEKCLLLWSETETKSESKYLWLWLKWVVLTVCQHFVYFLLCSKSHKCQKHAEQELMKMADKHRYCKNLPIFPCNIRPCLALTLHYTEQSMRNISLLLLHCIELHTYTPNHQIHHYNHYITLTYLTC